MYQQDFILRMIRQFTQVILQLAGLRQSGKFVAAENLLQETYLDLFGLTSTLLFHLPADELIRRVSLGDDDDPHRIRILAELLKVEGDLHADQSRDFDAHHRWLNSLALFIKAWQLAPKEASAEIFESISQLDASLQATGLSGETQADLFFYYQDSGHLDRALASLQTYSGRSTDPEQVRGLTVAFCQDLLLKTDEELAHGGVTRQQVESALHAYGPTSPDAPHGPAHM